MIRLTPDRTTEPVSRDQILRCKHGQGNINFPCSADHVQDWQRHPVDPYSCYMCDPTLLGMVEVQSVNAKNTTTTLIMYQSYSLSSSFCDINKDRFVELYVVCSCCGRYG